LMGSVPGFRQSTSELTAFPASTRALSRKNFTHAPVE
jgi:hypothetical protein